MITTCVIFCLACGDTFFVPQQCIANGVSYEKIPQEGSSITALEVFFSGYPRMVGLSLFPRLCQLTLVGQSISHIKGLEACPLLREFWVVECQLTVRARFLFIPSCWHLGDVCVEFSSKEYLKQNHIDHQNWASLISLFRIDCKMSAK